MGEILNAAKKLDSAKDPIDMLSVYETLIRDKDSEALGRRIRAFCTYFMAISRSETKLCDDEVRSGIASLLAKICNEITLSTSVELVTKAFIGDYVGRARKEILTDYSRKLRDCPRP